MKKSAKKLYNEYLPARLLMDCMDGNWDSWRDNYTRLTLTELSWFHVGLHNFVGVQSHYDFRRIKEVLDKIINDEMTITISELGCWRGYLAESLLKLYDEYSIKEYFGYDVDYQAIDNCVVTSSRFYPIKLNDWWHNIEDMESTVMLACHTIEHFTEDQLKRILFRCNSNDYKYLVWELPFPQDRGLGNWYGTRNTHMLGIDATVFQFVVKSFGYDFFYHERTSEGHMYGMIKRSYK